jgi:serine protease Do
MKRLVTSACLSLACLTIPQTSIARGDSTAKGTDGKAVKIDIPEPTQAIRKPLPESIDDLKEIQKQTRAVYQNVLPTVVGLQVGRAAGSGVIVSKDGLILTAGHVSTEPGTKVTILMHDGKRYNGVALGRSTDIDSGMIRITDKVELPFAKMAKMSDIKVSDWCIALGHPGGVKEGRSAVLRVGKLLRVNDRLLQTDCALVGGDSGGPLFDMRGRVIGIHSRIKESITNNVHVPIGTYRETWNRLVKGSDIGAVWIGLNRQDNAKDCQIGDVTPDSPASRAGLKVGDIITRFDNQVVSNYDEMRKVLSEKDPGDEIEVEIKRGDQNLTLKVKLSTRPKLGPTNKK